MRLTTFSASKVVSITGVGNKEKPYDEEDVESVMVLAELIWSITKQRRAEEVIEKYAFEDGLTRLSNRRRYNAAIEDEWNRHRRSQTPISLIMFDIDFFKQYNDHYGHDKGDQLLVIIAEILKNAFRRSGELVSRYGGEEFMVLMPNTNLDEARKRAEHARCLIMEAKISHEQSTASQYVSISGGVATTTPVDGVYHDLEKYADENLYRAKDQGLNRIV